jgi:beta-lactamase superfamily II metal-dependent hydrolase
MPNDDPPPAAAAERLMPPPEGAVVRMYRIGHGDCFLLAFAGEEPDKPVYVLIDCGYKPGSPKSIDPTAKTNTAKEITENIAVATGGHIHLAVITHEHQDHVNGISEMNFEGITIDKTWLAWTEDPIDDVANELRKVYKDKLLGLVAARNRLQADSDAARLKKIDQFLTFELGGEHEESDGLAMAEMLGAAAKDPANSANKRSMKVFKDRAASGVKYIRPHEEILTLPGTKDLRIFALGPPRVLAELKDLDPQGTEEFHGPALAAASAGNYFGAAAAALSGVVSGTERWDIPFTKRYQEKWDKAFNDSEHKAFFDEHYGCADSVVSYTMVDPDEADEPEEKVTEVPGNAPWRRIDNEWLYSADQLALDMNNETNNASLVLAFELGKGGKVLLFAGDAQRGNWLSWAKGDWTEGDNKITTKELLSRTVLYKAGHHCSHNATLNGVVSDDYPNISWMAAGKYGDEFTAMITAVWDWAKTQNGWNHPYPPIKGALMAKASGRVFQTDTNFAKMAKPADTTQVEWDAFLARAKENRLYFDYVVPA